LANAEEIPQVNGIFIYEVLPGQEFEYNDDVDDEVNTINEIEDDGHHDDYDDGTNSVNSYQDDETSQGGMDEDEN